MPIIPALSNMFLQFLFLLIFIPYQAYLSLHAIISTLFRLFISKKNMLDWVTAADAEKSSDESFKSYNMRMSISYLAGILLIFTVVIFKYETMNIAVLFTALWFIAPVMAYWISQDIYDDTNVLSENESILLRRIARKSWSYFEDNVNARGNHLPPDNYQMYPPNGIAFRTSPTNIGLSLMADLSARDFGFITTKRMIDIMSSTMDTVKTLEKWNGHLYNWYDTRTLQLLTPRYISTVDSGNLVCYLLTVSRGIEDILSGPLINKEFFNALFDTIMSYNSNYPLPGEVKEKGDHTNDLINNCTSAINGFQINDNINILEFFEILNSLSAILSEHAEKAGIKKYKPLQMILRQKFK